MSDLLIGRDLMQSAEKTIRSCLEGASPGEAMSSIWISYKLLSAPEERDAMVAVLISRVALGLVIKGAASSIGNSEQLEERT